MTRLPTKSSAELNTKAAFIAIAGSPNVGKSTILNRIIGAKLSIVSPKVQTTRTAFLGIHNQDNCQLVFVDTPGIFKPKKQLEEAIIKTAWNAIEGIDLIVLVIDAVKGFCEETMLILDRFEKLNIKPILVINKEDKVTKEKLQKLVSAAKELEKFEQILTISAAKNLGIETMLKFLASKAPQSQWYYPEDQMTTTSMKVIASEITREKLFLNLSDELPYNLTVETESWQQQKDGSVKVNQVIFVARDSHKQIILGNKGQMIKKIGMQARVEIEELALAKIHLFLFVKVRENWFSDPERYKYLGMQQPEKRKKS